LTGSPHLAPRGPPGINGLPYNLELWGALPWTYFLHGLGFFFAPGNFFLLLSLEKGELAWESETLEFNGFFFFS
jgi:hypothetical protein